MCWKQEARAIRLSITIENANLTKMPFGTRGDCSSSCSSGSARRSRRTCTTRCDRVCKLPFASPNHAKTSSGNLPDESRGITQSTPLASPTTAASISRMTVAVASIIDSTSRASYWKNACNLLRPPFASSNADACVIVSRSNFAEKVCTLKTSHLLFSVAFSRSLHEGL